MVLTCYVNSSRDCEVPQLLISYKAETTPSYYLVYSELSNVAIRVSIDLGLYSMLFIVTC